MILVPQQLSVDEALRRITGRIAIDTETTGLNPRRARIRLVQVATESEVYVFDCFLFDVRRLAPLVRLPLLGQNLAFDFSFLWEAGIEPPAGHDIFDTMIAAQLLGASRHDHMHGFSLDKIAKQYCGVDLAERDDENGKPTNKKTMQKSDWSGPLSTEQLEYAANDVRVLWPLYSSLSHELELANLTRCMRLEMRALPAFVWLEKNGVPVDEQMWGDLQIVAESERNGALYRLNQVAAGTIMPGRKSASKASGMREPGPWEINWGSPGQVLHILRDQGLNIWGTGEEILLQHALDVPLVQTLLDFRNADTRAKRYGEKFLRNIEDGRLHARYRQIGAASGRVSGTSGIMQIPRNKLYRKCIRAEGLSVLHIDYSQIQIRIMADQARDWAMIQAYNSEASDLHSVTAELVLGKPGDKEARQNAKAVNFGLLFGMGAAGLMNYAFNTFRVRLSLQQAEDWRWRWFQTYKGVAQYHAKVKSVRTPIETRTPIGRRRTEVSDFTRKLNSPDQGTEADGAKAALALLWESRKDHPGIEPFLFVHDEINTLQKPGREQEAHEWVSKCMKDGMSQWMKLVPVVVEAEVGPSWGELSAAGI